MPPAESWGHAELPLTPQAEEGPTANAMTPQAEEEPTANAMTLQADGCRGTELPLRQALVLGLAQGPAELLPISSSAHTALIPRLLHWPAAELPPDQAKTLEVALHSGAALGLGLALRRELASALRHFDRRQGALLRRQGALLALSLAPPAVLGYTLERTIERRLSGPRTIAFGLLSGSLAMALADLCGPQTRTAADAGARDGLALGVAQALALIPGVSRNGATLTAARSRGFGREDAQALSWRVALPVILGATLLKGRRLAEGGIPPGFGPALAVGAGAALLSTLACAPLISPAHRARRLWPFSLYRCALAAAVLGSQRDPKSRGPTVMPSPRS